MYQHENITLLNCDCLDYMATCERFDIAIVDPEYGIGFSDYERWSSGVKVQKRYTSKGKKKWDKNTPEDLYFNELFRIADNQIIWGGNYFDLPPTQSFIFWYKHNPVPNFADGEYAWTSFKQPAKCFDFMYYGNINRNQNQLHPTEKPIHLYRWIIKNYVKPNQSILDTHGGSMSIAIAVHEANTIEKMNLKLVVCEKDTDYYNDAVKRFKNHISQQKINFPL